MCVQIARLIAARLAREATLRVAARDVIVKGPFQDDFDVSPDGSAIPGREAHAPDNSP